MLAGTSAVVSAAMIVAAFAAEVPAVAFADPSAEVLVTFVAAGCFEQRMDSFVAPLD